jgi:hypothetical protein
MSTVDELKEETDTKELDDLERFLQEQGIHIRDELLEDRSFEDRKGMSSIFE